MINNEAINPLETEPLKKLLFSLAIPAILANIVSSLYNIVDQIFIGQGVGYIGNAATNIAFPITTICLAIGLLVGIGSASAFNLELGQKNIDEVKRIVGTSSVFLLFIGIIVCFIIRLFLKDLIVAFGGTEQTLLYAMEYTGITSYGIPFFLFTIGINPIVRADRSSKYSMAAILVGALMNTILDPIFIFVFNMGIGGAAWATVISQISSFILLALYFRRFNSIKVELSDFKINFRTLMKIFKLGTSSFIFQITMVIVQITINLQLKKYGAMSIYGSDIPIAVAGVVSKINTIYVALMLGLIQGGQPIIGYNYGAKNFNRVRKITKIVYRYGVAISVVLFILFQLFPEPIVSLFGSGNELYFQFASKYMRIFMMLMFLNGISMITMTFFPAIGKAEKSTFLSIVKQIGILLPSLLIFPKIFGVKGIVYATPVADSIAFILCVVMVRNEFKKMPRIDN